MVPSCLKLHTTLCPNLGFSINHSRADHVTALSRARLFQLRQLRLVRSSLTMESAKTLVHAFMSSRLDYCNSLLYGVRDELLQKLQHTSHPESGLRVR